MQKTLPLFLALLIVGCASSEAGDSAAANRPVADAVKGSPVVPKDGQGSASDEFNKLPVDVRARMPGGALQPPK